VGGERHWQAFASFVKRAGALRLSRETEVVSVGVDDRARRAAVRCGREIDEMETVVGAQSNVGDEKIERDRAQSRPRRLEASVRLDVGQRPNRCSQDGTRRVMRLDEQNLGPRM